MGILSKKTSKTKRAATKKVAKRSVSKKVTKRSTARKSTKKAIRRRPQPRQVPNYNKRNYTRPSPAISATLFPAGKRMRGNDGKWYKISIGSRGIHRWIKA